VNASEFDIFGIALPIDEEILLIVVDITSVKLGRRRSSRTLAFDVLSHIAATQPVPTSRIRIWPCVTRWIALGGIVGFLTCTILPLRRTKRREFGDSRLVHRNGEAQSYFWKGCRARAGSHFKQR
jgi:hypothetical protein